MEIFACNYGLNEAFGGQIRSNALRVSGYGEDGTVRMVELPGHPFFISTLFVPQMASESGKPHPLIVAYLEAASRFAQDRPYGFSDLRACDKVRPQNIWEVQF